MFRVLQSPPFAETVTSLFFTVEEPLTILQVWHLRPRMIRPGSVHGFVLEEPDPKAIALRLNKISLVLGARRVTTRKCGMLCSASSHQVRELEIFRFNSATLVFVSVWPAPYVMIHLIYAKIEFSICLLATCTRLYLKL